MQSVNRIIKIIALCAVMAAASVIPIAMADAFPKKPITIIVPYSAGGSNDNFVRAFAAPLGKALGTNIVVRNIAGGGGSIGMMQTLAKRPDGYTVSIASNALYTLQGMGTVHFKTHDFDYIARVATEPYVLAIPKKPEWADLDAFAKSAREKRVTIGFAGVGSSTHIMAVAISKELGFEPKFIPFNGGSAAVAAMLGGHIDGVVLTPAGIASAMGGGKITVIGSTGESEQLPDVTLFSDKGYDINTLQWRGIVAPAGLKEDVKARWITGIQEAVKDETFLKAVANLGVDVNPAYGEELESFVKKESDLLIALTKTAVAR